MYLCTENFVKIENIVLLRAYEKFVLVLSLNHITLRVLSVGEAYKILAQKIIYIC